MILQKISIALMAMMGAMASMSIQAAGLVDWSMYTEPTNAVSAISLPNFGEIGWDDEVKYDNLKNFAAIRISSEIATEYAGCEIKSIKPVSGIFEDDPSTQTITVSLAYSLDGDPIFTKEYHPVGSVMNWNTYEVDWNKDIIELDTEKPIVFEAGKEMYVILEYTETSDLNYEYVIQYDYNGELDIPKGSYYAAFDGTVYVNGEERTFTKEWTDISQDLMGGPLCVALVVDGAEGGVENNIELVGLDMPMHVTPASPFEIKARIHNRGGNEVTSVTAVCNLNGEVVEKHFELPPLVYDYSTEIAFSDLTWEEDAILPVSVTITGVNGETNSASLSMATKDGIIKCLEQGYFPNVVIEEGTGTWCGWCIRGIVGMDIMNERYPDGSFIGMAVHSGDEMEPVNAEPVFYLIDEWVGGYPSMIVNRAGGYNVTPELMQNIYDSYRQSVTIGKIDLDAYVDGNDAVVNTRSVFALNDSEHAYKIAYAVLEDNVGPYFQKNSYSGGQNGPMGGFEELGSVVEMAYNDVVRSYYGCTGVDGSVPSEVKKGMTYEYECRVPLTNVENKEEVYVVAMLLDSATGEIINAAKSQKLTSGSELTSSEAQGEVKVFGRTLVLNGAEKATVYTLDGVKLMELSAANGKVTVDAGIYIVRIGGKTAKLIVK